MASVKRRESGGEGFKVAVRVRPLIPKEIKASAPQCIDVDVDHKAVVITKPAPRRRANAQIGIEDFGEIIRTDTSGTHSFFFDKVFDPSSTQDMIFMECVQHIVESVLQGYNGSIIASGQTGSGKTYTIEGVDTAEGVIPRSTELIFSYIENFVKKDDRFLVRTSFLEIYNEKISDLLEPSRENLKIREDGVGGVFVEGLSEHIVRNTKEILALLHEGARLRTTAITRMNKESSRSHAVFTVIVEHATDDGCGGSIVTIGKLRLVDLAGSERLDVDAQSKQLEETKNINLSLHTFGKVVTQLTTPGARHIPYRESKLTRLLQDCLGGNCRTTLIATITPTAACYTESLNALKFAKRAKSIKNTAQVNKDMSQKALLSAYEKEITQLRHQLENQELAVGREEFERLERERKEAQKEKEEVISKLQAQERIVSEAQQEKDLLKGRIQQMEQMMLHGGSKSINDSDEFQQALRQEHERIRRETETELESKMAELEAEKRRLHDEREEIEKQKQYFAKLRMEFQPEGQKDDDSHEEVERGTSPVKEAPFDEPDSKLNPPMRKPIPDPLLISVRHPPSGANYSPSASPTPASPTPMPVPLPTVPHRIGSAELIPRTSSQLSSTQRSSWARPRSMSFSDSDSGYAQLSLQSLPIHIELDQASATALRDYALALAHSRTGIPCQEVSGVRIFTGSSAVKWFMMNMEGVINLQAAQDVGQRLLNLNVFTEIQGGTQFVISDSMYYQFCDSFIAPVTEGSQSRYVISRPSSSMSIGPSTHTVGRFVSSSHPVLPTTSYVNGTGSRGALHSGGPLASASGQSFSWDSSSISLSPSLASLHIEGDLLEYFGLHEHRPSPLHTAAIYGERSKLKKMAQQNPVDIIDAAGQTPLMYAVMGKQAKCCLQLLRLGADVNATSESGETALLIAATAECEDLIKILLKNGAQPHFINHEGQTAFHIAAKSQNYRCMEYMCKYAATLSGMNERDHQYHTPLHVAVMAGFPGHTKRLLTAKADLGVSDEQGRTALHYAVVKGNLPCIQIISESSANEINLVDCHGRSALHLACQGGILEYVTYLISYSSCDINLKDQNGHTPLHIAVLDNKVEIVKALIQRGANTTTRDRSGKTPLHYCMEMAHTDCAHVIQSSHSR